jgi:hypothetical protein
MPVLWLDDHEMDIMWKEAVEAYYIGIYLEGVRNTDNRTENFIGFL